MVVDHTFSAHMSHSFERNRQDRNKRRTLRRQQKKVEETIAKLRQQLQDQEHKSPNGKGGGESGGEEHNPQSREGNWGFWRTAETNTETTTTAETAGRGA
jgi:hypothetical protein